MNSNTYHVYPGQSIGQAAQQLRPGDTLIVHAGNYVEVGSGVTCPSRKFEALQKFDFFRFPPHAGSADSSIFRHAMVRRFLIMLPVISALLAFVAGLFRSRASLCLEHLALRHQLAVYKRTVDRPRLRSTDRVLWAWLARLWRVGAMP